MVPKSKVKNFLVTEYGNYALRVSGDFIAALDRKIEDELRKAVVRAKGNGRKTLQDYDL